MSAPLLTAEGTRIVAFGSWGSVCGYGVLSADRGAAERALETHRRDVGRLPGSGAYSDRSLVAVDDRGICWHVDYDEGDQIVIGGWVRTSGGRAARYTDDEMAQIEAA